MKSLLLIIVGLGISAQGFAKASSSSYLSPDPNLNFAWSAKIKSETCPNKIGSKMGDKESETRAGLEKARLALDTRTQK